jgi:hypothetical protein
MPKHNSFADIRADISAAANKSMPVVPVGSGRNRVGLVNAGNPDVLGEAIGKERGPKLESGPAWHEGLRNCTQVQHRPGKNDLDQLGRGKPITY